MWVSCPHALSDCGQEGDKCLGMRKNNPIVPGSMVVPRPGAWRPQPTGHLPWDTYAGELPLPLLTERSVDWDAMPAAALRRLAQGTPLEAVAEAYLKSFEEAVAMAYSVQEDVPPHPALAFLPPVRTREQEFVHVAVRRRLSVALMLLDRYADDDRDHYRGQLFVDTHLDWLAAVMRYGEVDDDFWLRDRHLTAVYPLPNRVRCADEMPNLAPLLLHADLFMESSKTKQAKSAYEDIARILAAKAKPAICHVRHVAGVLRQATDRHTMVGDLLLLIVHTVLAGAFPNTPTRANLALRLRLHIAFVGDAIGQRSQPLTIEAFWDWADSHKEALLKLIQVCSLRYRGLRRRNTSSIGASKRAPWTTSSQRASSGSTLSAACATPTRSCGVRSMTSCRPAQTFGCRSSGTTRASCA